MDFTTILQQVAEHPPLVHCITNYVTVNDVANILLACGGSPIMADDEAEAAEITGICSALALNIGTLNSRTIQSMLSAGKRANELAHPVVLDPVGAGASTLRTQTAATLLREVRFTVIRGNSSEIAALSGAQANTRGVDADAADTTTDANLPRVAERAMAFARQTGAVVAITGAIDLVADGERAFAIRNGHPMMSQITGTGCMLTGVVAAWCAANPAQTLEATVAAVCAMGLCGERAYAKISAVGGGTASLRVALIDEMSRMSAETLVGGAKVAGL